jgi:VWFA-related protein
MTKSSWLSIILLFSLIAPGLAQNPAPAQQSQDDDVVRITTNLIQVDATVTDKNGNTVTDLTADDFEILENGKEQKITNFSFVPLAPAQPDVPVATADPNAPGPPKALAPEQVRRTIAMVVDDLGLSFQSNVYARKALKKFVDEQMQPGDLVAIIRTAGGMGALQQFTSDKRQLYAAIDRMKWNPAGRAGVTAFAPITGNTIIDEAAGNLPGRSGDGNNPADDLDEFRDELYTVGTLGALNYIVRGLRELPGRKSVMLVSDGVKIFDRAGQSDRIIDTIRRLTDLANRASVVIYTMDARGLQSLDLNAEDNIRGLNQGQVQNKLLQRRQDFFESQNGLNFLAQQTGGLAIRNNNDLSDGIKRMLDDQQGYYLIGYRPDEGTFDPKKVRFNDLKIKIKRPGLKVRYRNGYINVTDENAQLQAPKTRVQQLVRAVASPFSSGEVDLRLTSLFANDPTAGSYMRSILHVDPQRLTFEKEPDGWNKLTFDVMAVTFGDNGVVVDEVSRTHTIRIRGNTLARILQNGFDYNMTVPVKKPGAYQLRAAFRDTVSERVGSAAQFIEVPDIGKNRLTLSGLIVDGYDRVKTNPLALDAATRGTDAETFSFEADPQAGPAVRRLRRGMVLQVGYMIYNARLDKSTGRSQLQTQIRLFRDGLEVFTGTPQPFDAGTQADLKRLAAGARLQLGTEMMPGEYVVQIVVTDLLAKDKYRVATQWIDFQLE